MTNEFLISELQRFYKENGNPPSCSAFKHRFSCQRNFGSWNKALEAAGLPVRIPSTKEEHPCSNPECDNMTLSKFCSRSCSAKVSNKIPKRKTSYNINRENGETCRKKSCPKCGSLMDRRSSNCSSCFMAETSKDWSQVTLADMHNLRAYQISTRVRGLARVTYRKSDKPKLCSNCGYDKHYEVCHIKAINSFSPETKVSDINSLDNLVALCPNCHWEFDNGLLEL